MRRNWWLYLTVLILLVGLLGIGAFPYAARQLPDRAQRLIPDPVWALVETPLPAALPAAQVTAAAIQTDLLRDDPPTAAPTATPAAHTPEPMAAPPTVTATPPPSPTPTPTIPPPPAAAQISGARIMAQTLNNCGPANLSMVVNFHGYAINQAQIGSALKPREGDANVSPWELAAFAAGQPGLEADYFAGGDVTLLKRLIAAEIPVIVEKGYEPSPRDGWMGHYLTLIGYDDAAQTFTGLDSYLGPWDSSGRPISYDNLLTLWQHFNYTFIVVYPTERATAVRETLGPQLLDRETMWRRAGQRAQLAAETTPDNGFAWFNLGTNLTQLGLITGDAAYYENAAAAYDQARNVGLPWRMLWYQFDIYTAYLESGRHEEALALANSVIASLGQRLIEESYFYRGQAYQAQGNTAAARADYRRTLEINPAFTPARDALAELDSGS